LIKAESVFELMEAKLLEKRAALLVTLQLQWEVEL
jgi:hypothetical protein